MSKGVKCAHSSVETNCPFPTLEIFENKKYGRWNENENENFSHELNFGKGLYLEMGEGASHDPNFEDFVPLYPNKLLDINGTPLPLSYGVEMFNVKMHKALWHGKSEHEKMILGQKIIGARLKKVEELEH